MGKPIKFTFGELLLDKIKPAIDMKPDALQDRGYGKELKVSGTEWSDGSISIEVYDPNTKQSIRVGTLVKSKRQPGDTSNNQFNNYKQGADTDLPF